MSKPDINFFDLQSNRTYRNLSVLPLSGQVIEGDRVIQICAPDGKYDDIMKGSRVIGTTIEKYLVGGIGGEDSIDFNKECSHLVLREGQIVPGKHNGITIKGGCEDILFDDLLILDAKRPHTHIDLGNHSDQSFKLTRRIEFREVRTIDNSPVILRVGHSEQPVLVGTNVKRLVFEGGCLKVYVYAKHFFPFIP